MRRHLARTVLAALGLAAATSLASPAQAIVGGTPTTIDQSPWQVLMVVSDSSLCSGALVAPNAVLTAAHCFNATTDPANVALYAGVSNLSQRSSSARLPIASISVHPGFDRATYANDLAVVALAQPVTPSATVATIALPSGLDPATWPAAGTPMRISGWGATTSSGAQQASDQLLAATVQMLTAPGAPCGQYGSSQPPDILCVGLPGGGVDTCQGDSGSPLVATVDGRAVLAGVTSSGSECAKAEYPGVYSSVPRFLPWITGALPAYDPATAPVAVPAKATAAGKRGATLTAARLATLTRLGAAPTEVRSSTPKVCKASGTRLRLLKAGTCRATVSANGTSVVLSVKVR